MAGKAFRIKCTQCSKLLQFVPRSAESQLTCPQCGRRMRVKTPQAAATQSGPARQARPSRQTPSVPAARSPQRPRSATPAPSSEIDWGALPSAPSASTSFTPRYAAPPTAGRFAGGSPAAAAPTGSFAAPKPPARKRSGGMGTTAKVLLTIGAVFVGGGVLLTLAVVALVMLAGAAAGPQSKSTMTLAGWSVDAPGRPAGNQQQAGTGVQAISHRTTGSEFSIATKQVAFGNQSFTVDQVFQSMKASNRITDERPVTRGGLEGFRFNMPAPGNGAQSTVELFKLDGSSVILLVYIPGTEKERVGIGKARFDEAKTRELDDPEAFFASLRKT